PHPSGDGACPGFDSDCYGLTCGVDGRLNREQAAVNIDVIFVLPASEIKPLFEISLIVIQADGYERNTEIRSALEVVAGENSEAAGINRDRLVQSELG